MLHVKHVLKCATYVNHNNSTYWLIVKWLRTCAQSLDALSLDGLKQSLTLQFIIWSPSPCPSATGIQSTLSWTSLRDALKAYNIITSWQGIHYNLHSEVSPRRVEHDRWYFLSWPSSGKLSTAYDAHWWLHLFELPLIILFSISPSIRNL